MEPAAVAPIYNLNEEQEKKLILREYRALLRGLKPKLKPGDKELVRVAFEMSADAHKQCGAKVGNPISFTRWQLHAFVLKRLD
jgi:GTP pyrophosphokinase